MIDTRVIDTIRIQQETFPAVLKMYLTFDPDIYVSQELCSDILCDVDPGINRLKKLAGYPS